MGRRSGVRYLEGCLRIPARFLVRETMMICPRCHTQNNLQDRFCEECGAPLPEADSSADGEHDAIEGAEEARQRACVLRWAGADGNQVYRVETRAVIGRFDNCDVALHDPSVSREHAVVIRSGNGYTIEDLGSTNGTIVNGQRGTGPVPLREGDVIAIGAIDLRFEVDDTPQGTIPLNGGDRSAAAPAATDTMVAEPPEKDHAVGRDGHGELGPLPSLDPVPSQDAREPIGVSSPSTAALKVHQALTVAHQLDALLQDLARGISDHEGERGRMLETARALRESNQRQEAVRRVLQGVDARSITSPELQATQNLLDELRGNPRDIGVLAKVAEQAAILSTIVSEYIELRRTLETVSNTLRGGPVE